MGTNDKDATKVVAPRAMGMAGLEQTNSPFSSGCHLKARGKTWFLTLC